MLALVTKSFVALKYDGEERLDGVHHARLDIVSSGGNATLSRTTLSSADPSLLLLFSWLRRQ